MITNINYAHIKNFKNIKEIALAKSEIINNTKKGGFLVLNSDDNFFNLHKKIAVKNKLKILSFGINAKNPNVKLINIKRFGKNFKANIRINNSQTFFHISNNFQNSILNVLAAITVLSIFFDVTKINKNIFCDFKIPKGRGDISKIRLKSKNLNLIDESYNSNPLSLKTAIINFDKLHALNSKKYLLLGDMLELGKHSKKLHQSIVLIINKTNINKVFVKGRHVLSIFNSYQNQKGRIFHHNSQIINLIKNDLKNNDYLMLKLQMLQDLIR